ncbi:chromate efflux transporter [Labrys okinawensis]|uniref:chromate efflux transporter n=1 Tax=Labrys okinawensis TaxID=346911 RepID=UPI0039BCB966
MAETSDSAHPPQSGHFLEILGVFLRLGLLSFGGPIAHLGYFNETLVKRRGWISQAGYTDLIALSQLLPGPSSSQVGFALGVLRGGGIAGGLAAWLGFTMPTVILLLAFAHGASAFREPWQVGLLHGLKLVAVAIVAHAVWSMARTLAWDRRLIAIAIVATAMALTLEGGWAQIGVIAMGALAGLGLIKGGEGPDISHAVLPISRRQGGMALAAFAVLFLGLPLLAAATGSHLLDLITGFFRSGSLVFGGGHVVLPLLHDVVVAPGWVSVGDFVAGYGATQAMPGPVFSFAAFLGAVASPAPNGVLGGMIAVVSLFLPGLLLIYGMLPFWNDLRRITAVQAAMRGVNAAVIGLLAAAFYQPLWTSTVTGVGDIVLTLGGFSALVFGRAPPWLVVIALGVIGIALGVLA